MSEEDKNNGDMKDGISGDGEDLNKGKIEEPEKDKVEPKETPDELNSSITQTNQGSEEANSKGKELPYQYIKVDSNKVKTKSYGTANNIKIEVSNNICCKFKEFIFPVLLLILLIVLNVIIVFLVFQKFVKCDSDINCNSLIIDKLSNIGIVSLICLAVVDCCVIICFTIYILHLIKIQQERDYVKKESNINQLMAECIKTSLENHQRSNREK